MVFALRSFPMLDRVIKIWIKTLITNGARRKFLGGRIGVLSITSFFVISFCLDYDILFYGVDSS